MTESTYPWQGGTIRMLDDAALRALGLDQTQIVDAVEQALKDQASGRIWTSPKATLSPGDQRYMMTTLSASDTPAVSVVKVVSVSPKNPAAGRPAINGTIMLHDSQTGMLVAVLDANWITAVRTAGLSGVVARKLANPQSVSVAFVGAGVQARSHLDCFAQLFPLERISVFGRGQRNIDLLSAHAQEMGLQVDVCDTAQAALQDADLVVTSVTATTLDAPFLDANWLKPGAFATITDTGAPWRQDALGALDRIVIDDLAQETAMKKKMVPADLITTDLNGLMSGALREGFVPQSRTAFVFRGIAIGDFAIAALAYQSALSS